MHHTPSAHVEMMDCAELLALFYWLQYRFVERLKREIMQRVREEERKNEAEHEESTIDSMHMHTGYSACIR